MVTNWNAKDERCPECNSVIKQVRGLNKQNLKKLFFTKPSIQDIMILVLIVLTLLAYTQYTKEVTYYREQASQCTINNPNQPQMGGNQNIPLDIINKPFIGNNGPGD